jgi:hypothetical protein
VTQAVQQASRRGAVPSLSCLYPLLCTTGGDADCARATDHYVAKQTGLLPEDPLIAALADQVYFFCEDIWQTL